MNFGELQTLGRRSPRGHTIENMVMQTILNQGALDVAQRTRCLKKYQSFNVTANTQEYSLSTLLTRYMAIDEPGLYWTDGSSQKQKLYPETVKSMDNKLPSWRGDAAASPLRFFIYGDSLFAHPKPAVTLASGFTIYFIQKPLVMTLPAHYPFGLDSDQTAERADLAILSDAILLYWRWKALEDMGEIEKAVLARTEYLAEVEAKREVIDSNLAISSDEYTKMMGPRVGG